MGMISKEIKEVDVPQIVARKSNPTFCINSDLNLYF